MDLAVERRHANPIPTHFGVGPMVATIVPRGACILVATSDILSEWSTSEWKDTQPELMLHGVWLFPTNTPVPLAGLAASSRSQRSALLSSLGMLAMQHLTAGVGGRNLRISVGCSSRAGIPEKGGAWTRDC